MSEMLDRVRKLLAKAEGVAGTPEADAFHAKAFELMAKHGIDEALARKASDRTGDTEDLIVVEWRYSGQFAGQLRGLAAMIAAGVRCAPLYTGDGRLKVFGVRRNIDQVRFLFPLLQTQMFAGASKTVTTEGDNPFNRSANQRYRTSWMAGYAEGIGLRLREAGERTAVGRDGGRVGGEAWMLLISDQERAKAALTQMYPNTTRGNAARRGAGHDAGSNAARSADIGQTRVGNQRLAISK